MEFSEHIASDDDERLNILSVLAHNRAFLFITVAPTGNENELGEPGLALNIEVGNGIQDNQTIVRLLFKTAFALQDVLPDEVPPDNIIDD